MQIRSQVVALHNHRIYRPRIATMHRRDSRHSHQPSKKVGTTQLIVKYIQADIRLAPL